jgi:hypothetical protein
MENAIYNDEYYENYLRKNSEVNNRAHQNTISLIQNILILSSSIFGILISLFQGIEKNNYPLFVFRLLCIVLFLCILSSSVSLSFYKKGLDAISQKQFDEIIAAWKVRRKVECVSSELHWIGRYAEIVSYITFYGAICILALYAFLVVF